MANVDLTFAVLTLIQSIDKFLRKEIVPYIIYELCVAYKVSQFNWTFRDLPSENSKDK